MGHDHRIGFRIYNLQFSVQILSQTLNFNASLYVRLSAQAPTKPEISQTDGDAAGKSSEESKKNQDTRGLGFGRFELGLDAFSLFFSLSLSCVLPPLLLSVGTKQSEGESSGSGSL